MPILTPVPLKDKIPFTANKSEKIKLPRNRFVRRIQLRLEVKATNGVTGPTLQEDNPLGIVKRIRININGNDTPIEVPMAWRWYIQKYLSGTEPERVQHSTTPSAVSTAVAEISIDFATDEKNEEDISALLQAHALTDFEIEVDWGDANNLATANPPTIDTAATFIKVSLVEADLTKEDLDSLKPEAAAEPRLLEVRMRTIEAAVTEAKSNFEFERNLKPGGLVQYHGIFAIDNSIRSDTLVDTFRFRQTKPIDRVLDTQRWVESQARDKREFSLESVVRGFTFMNWVKKGLLDLTEANEGDVKYEMINIAPTGTSKIILVQKELL